MSCSFGPVNPEVSVVMSCYNCAFWLKEAIASVLAQTYANYELILVDDGSTDETAQIIRKYRDQDKRIIAIFKRNTGLADSLNTAIAQARGSWIARIDADDLCEPARLKKQVSFLEGHPQVVLLGSGFMEIDDRGRELSEHLYPSDHRILVSHLQRLQSFFPHSSAIFSRRVIQGLGPYNTLFRKAQDWELWLRISERGRIACLRECLVRVRKHRQQITNSPDDFSQLVYAAAASVCHFLRIDYGVDPSCPAEKTSRENFIAWVNERLVQEGLIGRRGIWQEARTEFFAAGNRLSGLFGFSRRIMRSGHAAGLIREKLFGVDYPRRLARQWMIATKVHQ